MPHDTPDEIPDVPAEDGTAVSDDPGFPAGYKKGAEVGRGAMGVVFRAHDVALDRVVAVKLMQDRVAADERMCRRFLEEARLTARLQHPAIPPIHCAGTLPNGRPFLVMKLIRGRTLKALLDARTDPATGRADLVSTRGRYVAVFEAVAQAVGYAHDRKVIHRDLKPANVMVGAFGEVQVMDWGLAKVLELGKPTFTAGPDTETLTIIASPRDERDDGTGAGSVLGTPAYMSPEQAGGEVERIDERADVFGLGALLCTILTGLPPYVSGSVSAKVQAIRGDTGPALARLDGCGADPELVALARRCLAREPGERPRNGGEVAEAVAAWRVTAEERARRAAVEAATTAAAEAARDRAKQLYVLSLDGFNQMVVGIQGQLTGRPGSRNLQSTLLTIARAGLQRLVGAVERPGAPDRAFIRTHFQMGDIELALGNVAAAHAEFAAGCAMALEWVAGDPGNPHGTHDLSVGYEKLGDLELRADRADEAHALFTRAMAQRESLAGSADPQVRRDLGAIYEKVGDLELARGRVREARDLFDKARGVRHALTDEFADERSQRDLIGVCNKLAQTEVRLGRVEEARALYTLAGAVRRRLDERDGD